MSAPDAVDLFAGPGGWDVAAIAALGMSVVGIELDDAACATRAAAGLQTLQGDVSAIAPRQFRGVKGVIGSPPCPAFSMAGAGAGRAVMAELAAAIEDVWHGGKATDHHEAIYPEVLAHARKVNERKRPEKRRTEAQLQEWAHEQTTSSLLVTEPARWVRALKPTWVALEQVPPAGPLWRTLAALLREAGYATWTGQLNAADYGVPQTRKRAILMAHRDRHVFKPTQTHADCRQHPSLFLKPWVTMRQAIGAVGSVGFARRADTPSNKAGTNTVEINGEEYRARDLRDADEPAQHVTSKARSWHFRNGNQRNAAIRSIDEPAPTLHFGHALNSGIEWTLDPDTPWEAGQLNTGRDWQEGEDRDQAQTIDPDTEPAPTLTARSGGQWRYERRQSRDGHTGNGNRPIALDEPAPTIAGESRNDSWTDTRPATTVQGDPRIARPGHKRNADSPDAPGRPEGAIRVEIWQAAVLQDFPANYPWQGTRTKAFEQIGNAVPPGLALAILRELV